MTTKCWGVRIEYSVREGSSDPNSRHSINYRILAETQEEAERRAMERAHLANLLNPAWAATRLLGAGD